MRPQPQIVRTKVPRYIRRLIHDTSQCHYQREEYATVAERNQRYHQLRHLPGIVRYSDSGVAGLVYVVAWPRAHGADEGTERGMTPANRNGTPHSDTLMPENCQKSDIETVSMEIANPALVKIAQSDTDTVSIET